MTRAVPLRRPLSRAVAAAALLACTAVGLGAEADVARQILAATGVRGGVIVHVGCGDGALTASLRSGESIVVHGLDTDPARVAAARDRIRQLGIYGPVSIDRFDGTHLPYADNLVNLVVAEDMGGVGPDEAMRVLAPGGILYAKRGGRWAKTVKPPRANTDEWTHYLHDASGNAVSHDTVVGPPDSVQWIAEPRHTRSHEHIPGIYSVVSTRGRIFYIVDEAPISSIREPARWHLAARDAYNGLLLWKRSFTPWFPHIVNWGQTPNQLQRRLVAVGDTVYVTLGLHAPLIAVDAATGKTLKTYDGTQGTEEILCHNGILVLLVRSVTDQRVAELQRMAQLTKRDKSPLFVRDTAQPLVAKFRKTENTAPATILALDAETGRVLWKRDGPGWLRPLSLCASGDRVFYYRAGKTVCVELKTGRELWATPSLPVWVVSDGTVVCAGGEKVAALAVSSGTTLWTQPTLLCQIRDVFVVEGSLWLGGFKPWQGRKTGKRGPAWGPYFATQRELATGKVLKHVEPEGPGHHHRCWRNKATDRYILAGRRGVEFVDLKTGDVRWHSWVRGVCRYGVMPCNGLLYAPPHACGCYITAKLTGFYALAGEGRGTRGEGRGTEQARLDRGLAFGQPLAARSSTSDPSADWPTYRCNAARSGHTKAAVPAKVKPLWTAEVGGKLTAPTVAGGKVFVASVDEHRVSAIDVRSGKAAWHFTAGARVDSPPSVHRGRALFGCRDGCVYSVRTSDGAMAWRLHTARAARLVAVRGQLESASPVHGSVLVRGGVASFTAGRSSYLDGGIDIYRVEPETGKTLSRTPIYSPDPKTGKQPKQFSPSAMPGALEDILSSDGQHLYLRDLVFDAQGAPQPKGNPHLFTLTGFLDDSWPHRSYWIHGTKVSLSTGCSGRDRNLVYGRLIVHAGPMVYGYGRAGLHWSNRLRDGAYRIFALERGVKAPRWTKPLPIRVRAMVLAGKVLFVAGPPASVSYASDAEAQGARLIALSASDGSELAQAPLDASPVFDGMAAAGGRLYIGLTNGRLVCLAAK